MNLFKENRVKETITIPLGGIAEFFSKVYLDFDFQRWFRWPHKRGKDFFTSAIIGLGNMEIKVVSIEDALEFSKKINDMESLRYFTKIKDKGFSYVSLDGNSRTTWSSLFVFGFTPSILKNITGPKWDLHLGKYDLKYYWNYELLPKDENFRSTIAMMTKTSKNKSIYPSFALNQIKDKKTIKQQSLFKYNNSNKKIELDDKDISNLIEMYEYYISKIKFNIEIWGKITKPEMHKLFINYNQNEEINSQDIRNAEDCGMSKSVRTIPQHLLKCLELNMTSTSLIKRIHHEMIGYCMYYLQHETSLKNGSKKFNTKGLDSFWNETRDSKFSTKENTIWDVFTKLANTQTNSLNSKPLFLDIFAIAKWIVQNNIATSLIDMDIDDDNQNVGWEKVMKLHAEWMEIQRKKKNIYKVGKGRGDWEAYRGGIQYFTYKDDKSHIIEWSDSLELFLSNILKDDKVNLFVIKDERTSKVNTPIIRLALWKKQNGIDTLTGLKIPFKEIYNTDRNSGYEVDHDLALENGGLNDFENLRLVSGLINAKKSDKIDFKVD
jgi:hypothetical protein